MHKKTLVKLSYELVRTFRLNLKRGTVVRIKTLISGRFIPYTLINDDEKFQSFEGPTIRSVDFKIQYLLEKNSKILKPYE
mgnify:CR=1 FL=1